ncbi:hypothetical protein NA57DRAFT_79737 [Rhizodiscina lignyota]|uniref:Protein FAF1 n=1 Tax=Rhizodiscina lignyota TaxID=1504668 RepID=A0A9P4M5F1_9PEZI|nr:hypothetical protein NA57DRAFT_79737 [Rhizodiscina lignyota]
MAISLGKRKRHTAIPARKDLPASDASTSDLSDGEDVRAIFQRAFEARFKPLGSTKKKTKEEARTEVVEELLEDADGDDEEYSEWDGFSSDAEDSEVEEVERVEVVEHMSSSIPELRKAELRNRTSKAEARAFMSSKIPSAPKDPLLSNSKDADSTDDESTNLQNDASLQRLLRESHLLSTTPSSSSTFYPSSTPSLHSRPSNPANTNGAGALAAIGAARHAAHDLHFLSLGGKPHMGLKHQKSMPLAQRKGIAKKREEMEERRRREAKEMGVVLERAVGKKGSSTGAKRERGVGAPGVGKFKGGTLTLSKRDVASIQGSGKRRR